MHNREIGLAATREGDADIAQERQEAMVMLGAAISQIINCWGDPMDDEAENQSEMQRNVTALYKASNRALDAGCFPDLSPQRTLEIYAKNGVGK